MFSFFKRSKSQKGKQKHEKLQPNQLQPPAACREAPADGEERTRQDVFSLAANGAIPAACGDGGAAAAGAVASKVASGANAGANGGPPAGGDEEKQRAKNNNPHGPPPSQPPAEGCRRREWLPSVRCATADGGEGPARAKGRGGSDVPLERDPPNATTVSSSGPTYQSGSVTRGRATNGTARNDDDDFPPIDSVQEEEAEEQDDRDPSASSPIDDSRNQRRQQQGPQHPNATSSNPYAPPNESAMAKGKNRRRYQPQQQQTTTTASVAAHQHQQHHIQVTAQQQAHHQQQQQQQNVIRRPDSSSVLAEQCVVGKKTQGGPVQLHRSLPPPALTTIVLVDQATPIKVRRLEGLEGAEPQTIIVESLGRPLQNGSVTDRSLQGTIDDDQHEHAQPVTANVVPLPNADTDGVGDPLAKTHTTGRSEGGGGVAGGHGENVALVLPCADAPQPLGAEEDGTHTDARRTRQESEEALLNIRNISPTTTAGCGDDAHGQREVGEADRGPVVEAHDRDGRALELGPGAGWSRTGSSEPAAIPAISKQTTDAVVGNGSVEEALAASPEVVVVVARGSETTIQEMGQQPSRADSEAQQGRSSARASKSTSPQRAAPAPPPRTARSPTPVTLLQTDLEAITGTPESSSIDAPGDDTSDDRDVFYEAKETLSPPVVVPAGSATGTPEPIRASLVLKIAPEPAGAAARRAASERRKKQVSFKLTQNGSDDVEVTSVDGTSSSDEGDDPDGDSESASASGGEECTVPPPTASTAPSVTNSECAHNHPAFSESNNSKPTPTLDVCSFGGSTNGSVGPMKKSFIEFKYDNSAPADGASLVTGKKDPAEADVQRRSGDGVTTPVESEKQLQLNGDAQPTSVSVLIEESVASLPDVVQQPTGGLEPHGKTILPPTAFGTVEKINSEMKDLVNQECRYSAKFEEAEKRVNEANAKVYELQQKLDAVERDALLKEYNVERLQAELVAALKECDGIRARLTTQQAEMEAIRLKASEREDELNLRYQNLEVEQLELNEKLKEVRHLAHDLNGQLIDAKSEVDRLKVERQQLLDARTEEQKIMREALEESVQQRAQVEAKWKHDFEQLRNVNNDREEHLMKDCEFTVRNMQKTCKEKVETADRERKQALEKVGRLEELTRRQTDEVRQLKSVEAEVEQLRGLTYDQKEALASMTRQVEGLKAELETAYSRIEEEMVKVQQIKNRCEYQLCEKEREALNRIEIARGEIAMQWEDRLLHEMNRLKVELEQMHMEERTSAIEKMRRETLAETEALGQRFNARERQLKDEIESLKATVEQQKTSMSNAQSEADQKLVQSRMYVERAEREHEQALAKEMDEKNEIIDNLKRQFEQEKLTLEQHFTDRIHQVQEEFAREISDTTEMMRGAHKKELENQWKQLVAEKEEALKLMDSRNRNRLEDAENKIRELTTGHQRQLKDLQDEHGFVVHSLESRDTKNTQEIQTLHKKCRCLTNLFEEMRLRYERRESRPEDLQEIDDLKRVIDSQERDLRLLTEALREAQLHQMQQARQQQQQQQQQQQHQHQQPLPPPPPRRSKPNRGKQSKQQQQSRQQQQQQQQQKQQKNSRPAYPAPEPETVPAEADDQELDEVVGYVQAPPGSTQQASAPQVVLIPPTPPAQLIPPVVHRTKCDVIYEENEADIQREEEEAQLKAVHNDGDRPAVDDEQTDEEDAEEDEEEAVPQVVVVDLPESAIETEDRPIESTTPTIIEDEMEQERTSAHNMDGRLDAVGDGCPPFMAVVVPIENVEDANIRPRASSTPRIVITDDTTESNGDGSGSTMVVEITEEPPTCVTPVIELPAVFAKIYPSEVATEAAGDSAPPTVLHSGGPEMATSRTPEGHGEGSS